MRIQDVLAFLFRIGQGRDFPLESILAHREIFNEKKNELQSALLR